MISFVGGGQKIGVPQKLACGLMVFIYQKLLHMLLYARLVHTIGLGRAHLSGRVDGSFLIRQIKDSSDNEDLPTHEFLVLHSLDVVKIPIFWKGDRYHLLKADLDPYKVMFSCHPHPSQVRIYLSLMESQLFTICMKSLWLVVDRFISLNAF